MDSWNTATHGRSGLTERVRVSTLDEEVATDRLLEFLAPLVPRGKAPMCGNSICQDRRFMARWMPRLEAYFHYRNVDVSTLKELARRWQPEVLPLVREEEPARGARRHLRVDRRTEALPRALPARVDAGSGITTRFGVEPAVRSQRPVAAAAAAAPVASGDCRIARADPLAAQRDSQREQHRAEDHADEAERDDAAEHAEEDQGERQRASRARSAAASRSCRCC